MTRVAIVAPNEALRASIAEALRRNVAFEVVAAVAFEEDVPRSVDVVLVAREADGGSSELAGEQHDAVVGTILTAREREVLALLADGLGNKQIAARLGISVNTVKTHVELLFEKLSVSSRAEAVATGVRRGLLML
jgi:DNA-binding CsgD family transcriptional regulator